MIRNCSTSDGSRISTAFTSAWETIPGACRWMQRPPMRLAMFEVQSSAEKR